MKLPNFLQNFIKTKSGNYGLFWSKGDNLSYNQKTPLEYLNYNEISLYVNRAIDARAEKIGEVKFLLKNEKGDVIEDDPILDLLNRPNDFHTGKQFWKLYQKYYDICGSAYILKVSENETNEIYDTSTLFTDKKKIPTELHLLRPDRVTLLFNKDYTEISGFRYAGLNGITTDYTPDQVIYSFNPNPSDPLRGASLLLAGIRTIETEVQIAEYQNKILKNGGQVDTVFTFENNLTEEQIKNMEAKWQSKMAGAKNAGKPLFLGGKSDIKRLGLNPNELSFLTSKNSTLDDISILTGVPVSILGKTSDQTYANADASIAIFLRERIKPLLIELTTILDWHLIPDNYDLEFIDPTPEDMDRKMKVAETMNTINALTTNEKREMFGFPPVEGGDEILIPFSLSPLNGGTAKVTPPADQAKAKRAGEFENPLKDKVFRKKYGELMVKRMDKHEAIFLSALKGYFDDQRARLVDSLGGKKSFKRKSLIDELFDSQLEIKLAKTSLLPILKNILLKSGAETYQLVSDKPFKFVLSSEIDSWLDKRAGLFSNQINDTTFTKLKNQFSESFDQQETRQQLVERIQNTYAGFDEGRAKTIARTEVHAVTNKGTVEGYTQAGLKTKIWVAVMDEATRDSHAMTDGEEEPIDHPFSNGLDFPGDPNGAPEEVINCRCVI